MRFARAEVAYAKVLHWIVRIANIDSSLKYELIGLSLLPGSSARRWPRRNHSANWGDRGSPEAAKRMTSRSTVEHRLTSFAVENRFVRIATFLPTLCQCI
jgi:hypothetical protein